MSRSTPAVPPVGLVVDRATSSSSSGTQAKKKQRVSPISKAEVDLMVGFIDATTRKSGATAQLQNKILIRGSSDGSLHTLYEAWQAFYPGTCLDEERFWEFATRRCFPPTGPHRRCKVSYGVKAARVRGSVSMCMCRDVCGVRSHPNQHQHPRPSGMCNVPHHTTPSFPPRHGQVKVSFYAYVSFG